MIVDTVGKNAREVKVAAVGYVPIVQDRHGRIAMTVGALGVMAALSLLFALDPAEGGPFPPCPWRALTGLLCPGCGALRGTHALLHGYLAEAWRYNQLWLMVAPLLGAAFLWASLRAWGVPLPAARVPAGALWGMLLAVIAFGVLRNL